jgi:hypothetical protein
MKGTQFWIFIALTVACAAPPSMLFAATNEITAIAVKNTKLIKTTHSTVVTVPADVLAAVQSAPLTKYGETFDATPKALNAQILKYEWLTINENAVAKFTNISYPWVAIVAKNISIENAPTLAQKAVIELPSDSDIAPLVNGKDGSPFAGPAQPGGYDTGQDGAKGAEGSWGQDGSTVNMPAVFIFFENINVATQQPAGGVHIRFVVDGAKGGNGGNGGRGQDGGAGASGTSSSCGDSGWPLHQCNSCNSGPGDGGRGGQGGTGGRGGSAAVGGAAANVWFVGPQSSLLTTSFFGVSQKGGSPGTGGGGGVPGDGGVAGGGGYDCSCCLHGGGSKGPGPAANPLTRGLGPAPTTSGIDGDTYRVLRDNSDLWVD